MRRSAAEAGAARRAPGRSPRLLLRDLFFTLHTGGALPALDWDLAVRQARRAGLLARLGFALEERGLMSAVPAKPRDHLTAECILADKHARDVRWEVRCIKADLARLDTTIVLLKGAAYTMADLPPARGRLFADIDIMVPIGDLDRVEQTLLQSAWHHTPIDAYDERYYRHWMHQIPPLTHYARGTTVDVHHTIVARTARHRLRADKLFAAAVPVPGDAVLKMLAPPDMVLHSATHLLNEGEFNRGLRDLVDLHLLLSHFGGDQAFWPGLLARAEELGLTRALYYALRYAARYLGTAVPAEILAAKGLAPPNPLLRWGMDRCFDRALRPHHPSCRDGLSGAALAALYLRGHYLLMPLHILLPHLARKAIMGLRGDKEDARRAPLLKPR